MVWFSLEVVLFMNIFFIFEGKVLMMIVVVSVFLCIMCIFKLGCFFIKSKFLLFSDLFCIYKSSVRNILSSNNFSVREDIFFLLSFFNFLECGFCVLDYLL